VERLLLAGVLAACLVQPAAALVAPTVLKFVLNDPKFHILGAA
jgi:hypothetical protein